jgi:hypothetical protein
MSDYPVHDKAAVVRGIQEGFAAVEYPGDAFLVGSHDGCEPEEAVHPFRAFKDWRGLDAAFLDEQYTALSFFSEAGLRFFLPAYLLADMEEALRTAEPLFHLISGFYDGAVQLPGASEEAPPLTRRYGGSVLLNPRRYGALTFNDHARFRLSVFCREEAKAIIDYLTYKRDTGEEFHRAHIQAALKAFWLDRAANAPEAARLKQHVEEERQYVAAIAQRGPS